MTNQPPRKVKVLTRLKITEVSAVDRGAGENCRIVLSKRDDNYDPAPLSNAEHARAQLEGRAALRHQEEMEKRAKRDRDDELFNHFLGIFKGTNKSFAAVERGDEADEQDEQTRADELAGDRDDDDSDADTNKSDDGEHHASKVADLLVESGKHPDRRAALDHLLHTAQGAAMLRRLHKHEDSTVMTTSQDKLRALAKSEGVAVICKIMVADQRSYGITQDELVDLISNHERQDGETAAKCFSRHYEADTADGLALRKAVEITKNAPLQDDSEAEKDAAAACRELAKIGAERWPSLTVAQRFARAAETHPELLQKAHKRPSPLTSFPWPR